MGKAQLDKPRRIGEKVKRIRLLLGLTQVEMCDLLRSHGAKIHSGYIGLYEVNERIPTLLVILAYARAAGVSSDCLIDDAMELPRVVTR